VRHIRWDNNDLAGTRFLDGRSNGKGSPAFLYDEYLWIGVLVQSYRTAGRHVNPDK
jgi:hypothetical protein